MLGNLSEQASNFIIKETLLQVFSSEFCEISKNTFFYRTPPVAASVIIGSRVLEPQKFFFREIPYNQKFK